MAPPSTSQTPTTLLNGNMATPAMNFSICPRSIFGRRRNVNASRRRLRDCDRGYEFRGLWRHRRKDGSTFRAEIQAFRFVHEGAERELVLAQDVTARVETEEALLRSQAAFEIDGQ